MGPPLSPSESGGMGFKGKPVSKGHGAGKSKDLGKGSLAKGPQSKGKMDLKGLKGKTSKGWEAKGSGDGNGSTPDKGKGKLPTPDKGKGKPAGKKGKGASKDEIPKTTTCPARTES